MLASPSLISGTSVPPSRPWLRDVRQARAWQDGGMSTRTSWLSRIRRAPSRGAWRAVVALALGLTVAGCPQEEPPPNPPPSSLRLEVGAGRDQFTALVDGDTLQIHRGCQGSQHTFVSLRAWGLPSEPVLVDLSLTRTEDGQKVSQPSRVRYLFPQNDDPEAAEELVGLLLPIPSPDAAVGKDVRLMATVQTDAGDSATDARTGTLQWGPDACP
jgi:hypothetical protein